jgi:uncharacterized protein YbjT (DUF2867 family)
MTVLVVGATGSIGRLVVEEAARQGHAVRALVRDARKADQIPDVEIVVGDLTRPDTLPAAVDGVTRSSSRTDPMEAVKPRLSALTTEVFEMCSLPSAADRHASH